MEYNESAVDDMVLALIHLTTFKDRPDNYRAWKAQDWEVLDRLHKRGLIGNPKSKMRSVDLTAAGQKSSALLFKRYFGNGHGRTIVKCLDCSEQYNNQEERNAACLDNQGYSCDPDAWTAVDV